MELFDWAPYCPNWLLTAQLLWYLLHDFESLTVSPIQQPYFSRLKLTGLCLDQIWRDRRDLYTSRGTPHGRSHMSGERGMSRANADLTPSPPFCPGRPTEMVDQKVKTLNSGISSIMIIDLKIISSNFCLSPEFLSIFPMSFVPLFQFHYRINHWEPFAPALSVHGPFSQVAQARRRSRCSRDLYLRAPRRCWCEATVLRGKSSLNIDGKANNLNCSCNSCILFQGLLLFCDFFCSIYISWFLDYWQLL